MRLSRLFSSILIGLSGLALLSSCGGGGSGQAGGAAARSATVGVALTDAPAPGFDEALATITGISLLGGPGPVSLFSGRETIDLLRLADYAELFAVNDDVPAGTYSKVRLQLANLELIRRNPDGSIASTETPKLVGNGKLDLNPQGGIFIAGGATLVITLDFDVAKSLKITETGNGKLILRPVVFVDITTSDLQAPGLVRVHGVVSELDPVSGTLRLCQTRLVARDHGSDQDDARFSQCLRVSLDNQTGLFGGDGLPIVMGDLANGDRATVIGRLSPRPRSDDDDRRFDLLAVTVERGPLGTFDRLRGTVASPVNPALDQFGLSLLPGQGLVTAGPLTTQLYPRTRIFSADGIELQRSALVVDQGLTADAVLALASGPGGENILRAALLVLQDRAATEEVLRGPLLSVNAASGQLLVATTVGDRCVNAAAAEVFLVDATATGIQTERGTLADLAAGQTVNIFGTQGVGGCFDADTLLADVRR